jgi:xanthine dehydrogenase accessory factor
MVIAVVGSGGKTTRIHKLAEEYRNVGKKVLVTTTTHMFMEEDCDLSGNVESIKNALDSCGYCMAGLPAEHEKIQSLPETVYKEVCDYADIVLVEADGSRGLPVKYPSEKEPVIPENAEEIQIVTGLSAIGKPLGSVCHRKELVMQCLGESEDTILTAAHLQTLVKKGYEEPLKEKYSEKKVKVCAGQVNTLYERVAAQFFREGKDVSVINPGWFETKPKLMILGGGHVGSQVAYLGKYLDFDFLYPLFRRTQR